MVFGIAIAIPLFRIKERPLNKIESHLAQMVTHPSTEHSLVIV